MRARPARLRRSRADDLSYPELGATRDAALPAGYDHLHRVAWLGRGPSVFAAARAGLQGWRVQCGSGMQVYPPHAVPVTGCTVLLGIGPWPLRIVAPCRVIWTVDEPDRAGFAYGTLAGHPERGEESFVVSRDAADDVWFTIRAFSRPATWYARLGSPVTRLAQHLIAERYLRALLPKP